MVRWAPSAVNAQPWRVVLNGRLAHFYEKRSRGFVDKSGWDLQTVDIGIAMYHFACGMEEKVTLILSDPGLPLPEDTHYIATLMVDA